ncbi:hypothetical protein VPH35_123886 [Triticum aestivum]
MSTRRGETTIRARVPVGAPPRLGNGSHETKTNQNLLGTAPHRFPASVRPSRERNTSRSTSSMAVRCHAAAALVSSRARLPSYLPPLLPSARPRPGTTRGGGYRRTAVRAMGAAPSSPSPSGQAPGHLPSLIVALDGRHITSRLATM